MKELRTPPHRVPDAPKVIHTKYKGLNLTHAFPNDTPPSQPSTERNSDHPKGPQMQVREP